MIAALRRQLKAAFYGVILRSRLAQRGRSGRRQVALTFDDGPDDLTHAYLDLLDELQVRATFFVVGKSAKKAPAAIGEYLRRGHQIASHGYDHRRFPRLAWGELATQLRQTEELVGAGANLRSWVRPPYGDVDLRVLAQLVARGNMIALWSLDSHDYQIHDPEQLVARCSPHHVSPGEVILLHEGQKWTLAALPRIVTGLRDAGYTFVTMAEMFDE